MHRPKSLSHSWPRRDILLFKLAVPTQGIGFGRESKEEGLIHGQQLLAHANIAHPHTGAYKCPVSPEWPRDRLQPSNQLERASLPCMKLQLQLQMQLQRWGSSQRIRVLWGAATLC